MIIILGEQLIDLAGSKSDVLVTATWARNRIDELIYKDKKAGKSI